MTLTDWMQLNTFQSRRSIVPFVFCLKAVCFQMGAIILSWQRASLWSRRGRQSLPVSHLSAMNVEFLLIYDESLLFLLCFVVKVNNDSFDYGLKIIVIVFVINVLSWMKNIVNLSFFITEWIIVVTETWLTIFWPLFCSFSFSITINHTLFHQNHFHKQKSFFPFLSHYNHDYSNDHNFSFFYKKLLFLSSYSIDFA